MKDGTESWWASGSDEFARVKGECAVSLEKSFGNYKKKKKHKGSWNKVLLEIIKEDEYGDGAMKGMCIREREREGWEGILQAGWDACMFLFV